MNKTIAAVAAVTIGLGGSAWAHEKAKSGSEPARQSEERAFGREGDPKKASRTARLDMSDAMRFTPAGLRIKEGETIRFVLKNSGKMNHEMVLGTMQDLKEHAEMMRKHPGMEHDEPHMVHVTPGQTARMVWQFSKRGEFYYGCLIPGHFEAGMIGKITVTP